MQVKQNLGQWLSKGALALLFALVLGSGVTAQVTQGSGQAQTGGGQPAQAPPPTTPPPATPPVQTPPPTPPPATTPPAQQVPVVTVPAVAPPNELPLSRADMAEVPTAPGDPFQGLRIFGQDYFAEARQMVSARRAAAAIPTPTAPVPATTTVVGPELMARVNVSVPVPDRYQLGPGDSLMIRYSSPTLEMQSAEVRIDARGGVFVPVSRTRLVLRGLTLDQANRLVLRELRQYIRDVSVDVQLQELRTFPIRILGEAFAPGTYEVPSVITLFNALYAAGGPSDLGSFRRILLQRSGGTTRRIDLYGFLMRGDASVDIPLQPGDTIVIPPAEVHVALRGEVRRPAIYELLPSERLREALFFAGGARPSGVTQRVSVISVRPGIERKQVDVNLLRNTQEDNPQVFDGDLVEVFSIRPNITNAVQVDGAVDQPRMFAHQPGMRVSALVDLARGLLSDASVERADLFRLNGDGSRTLIPIRLKLALEKDPEADVEVQPNDRLLVYRKSDLQFLGTRKLTVHGAVQRPGLFYRADGMTLRDLLLQAGGLLPNANDRVGLLQRTQPDGRPGPLEKINLRDALTGSAGANLPLQDEDILIVQTFAQAEFFPDQIVEVQGAVQRPGNYTLSEGMTISDLLALVGGPLPTAAVNKAFLQRVNPNGTQGPLLILDLDKARQGDAEHNVRLQPQDKLSVYLLTDSQYRIEETITVRGALQRPGTFPRSDKMTMKDVVDLAGGILPSAADMLEISRAWSPLGTPVQRIPVMEILTGGPGASVAVQPGDTITVPSRTDVLARPRIVTIMGSVRFPGPYMLTGANDRMSYLIQRAGGFTERAFPEGAEFVRDPQKLVTPRQLNLTPEIAATFNQVAADEYKRASALADLDRLRIVFSQGASISTGGMLFPQAPIVGGQQPLQPGQSLDQALAQALRSEAATQARSLSNRELIPSGNLNINLVQAIQRPGAKEDLILLDGDVLMVPDRPTTVNVTGAVALPSSIVFEPGRPISYYVDRAGGLTNDADVNSIVIVRATGALIRYRRGVRVELGDNILVPTRVLAVRLREQQGALQQITQGITSAGLSIALINALSR